MFRGVFAFSCPKCDPQICFHKFIVTDMRCQISLAFLFKISLDKLLLSSASDSKHFRCSFFLSMIFLSFFSRATCPIFFFFCPTTMFCFRDANKIVQTKRLTNVFLVFKIICLEVSEACFLRKACFAMTILLVIDPCFIITGDNASQMAKLFNLHYCSVSDEDLSSNVSTFFLNNH